MTVNRFFQFRPCFLSLLLLASACREPATRTPAIPPTIEAAAPVDSLYNRIGDAELEGIVETISHNPALEEQRDILVMDFESGGLKQLQIWTQDAATRKTLSSNTKIIKAPEGNNRCVVLPSAGNQASSLQTAPIPVQAGARYTLTFRQKTRDLSAKGNSRARIGCAEALFFSVPSYQHNPVNFLAKAEDRKKNQVRGTDIYVTESILGTTDWKSITLEFKVPERANFLILSLDHSRNQDDSGTGLSSKGEVYFDDLKLTSFDRPMYGRYQNPDDLTDPRSPLQVKVELPSTDRGAETRAAIFAPAPSTLRFSRTISPGSRLSLTTGVLREGWVPDSDGVTFVVNVVDSRGKTTELLRRTHRPGDKEDDKSWQNALLDLDAFVNQQVTIELKTLKKSAVSQGLTPADCPVWGDPVLFSPTEKGRLIVLTVIDTVAANHVRSYGYFRNTTPYLDAMGKRGVLFSQAYSAAPWTLPSFASMFTGYDAIRHGAGERNWEGIVWRRPLAYRYVTLAEILRARGFQTVAFMNNPYLTSAFGLDQGFTTYIDYGLGTKSGAGEVGVNRLTEWLETHRGYDRFVVMHLMDAHGPYRPPKSYASTYTSLLYSGRFKGAMGGQDYLDLAEAKKPVEDEPTREHVRNLYDGALHFADAQTGRLIDFVDRHAGTGDVTFIITSDHGEELWDHGNFDHGQHAYNELLKIPWVMENPARWKSQTIDAPVRLTDLLPTLLGTLDLPVPAGLDGLSLNALLSGTQKQWPLPRLLFAENQLYGNAQAAIIREYSKYLYNMENSGKVERRKKSADRYELYDLKTDPGEKNNRALDDPALVQELHDALEPHLKPVFAGRYVLVLDGGSRERTFSVKLELPVGAGFFNYYEDLIAPTDGRTNSFKVVRQKSGVTVEITTARAILAFRAINLPKNDPRLILSADVDGTVWREGYRISTATTVGAGEAATTLTEEQLTIDPEQLPARAGDSPFIFIGKTPERGLGLGRDEALPAETEERLKALGYTQ